MRTVKATNQNTTFGASMLQTLSLLDAQGIRGLDIFTFLVEQTTMQGFAHAMKSRNRSESEQYTINIGRNKVTISGAIRNRLTGYAEISQKWINEDKIDYQDITIKLLDFSVAALTHRRSIFIGVNYNDDAMIGTGPGEIVYKGPRRGVQLMVYCLELPTDDIFKAVNADLEVQPVTEFAILHTDLL
ncbi:MAG TPA: hypothetical protein PKD53_01550 [Chloroflexaceae bacterium]|nr:hypothetical protein [Chloroflexaceae bacterium]